MNKILLQNNKGYSWYGSESCHVRGYIYEGSSGRYYEGESLLRYFSESSTEEDLHTRIAGANGLFSLIIELNGELFLALDIIRSLPLFYTKIEGEWFISDSAWHLKDFFTESKIGLASEKEFLGSGFVTGYETLIDGLFQVQAGEIVKLNKDPQRSFYFTYRVDHVMSDSFTDMRKHACEVFDRTGKRLINALRNRTVLLPLSGGFDSRMLAVQLKREGYEKVICFTYGRKGNPEMEISRKVAECLGYKWLFIEYTPELLEGYMATPEFKKYIHWGSNLVSMFYLQEYFAVKYLKDQRLIPENSVFIPGHSGDFLGGSQFQKHHFSAKQESVKKMVDRILAVKYFYSTYSRREQGLMKERIRKSLDEKFSAPGDYAYSIHEDWDLKEKLAKFNLNSATVYTFFGYEFLAPYWDLELVSFFRDLPVSEKMHKKLYDDILVNDYFTPFEVNFSGELQEEKPLRIVTLIKNTLKNILPPQLVDKLVKKFDAIGYYESTAFLLEDLKDRGIDIHFHGNKYNTIIIKWYLEEVKKNLFS